MGLRPAPSNSAKDSGAFPMARVVRYASVATV